MISGGICPAAQWNAVFPNICRKNREGRSRFGYTVSARLGHAVVRNRVRRRLREIVRLNGARLVPGYDVVIVARSRCVDAEYRKMEEAYLKAIKKLGLLREDAE